MRAPDEIVPLPAPDLVLRLLYNLRPRDRLELLACGYTHPEQVAKRLEGVTAGAVYLHDWAPAAVVAFAELTPGTLSAGLLATEAWPLVARRVARHGMQVLRPWLLGKGYRRAECRTIAGHDDAIRLLERLGFVCECRVPLYGKSGETFLQYAWRLDDHEREGKHVHFPKASQVAGGAADQHGHDASAG